MKKRLSAMTLRALLVSIALIFSYVEMLLPLPIFLPGMKAGLANIVIVFVLYRLSLRDAVLCSAIRILLTSLLFGSVVSLAYSLVGAVCSLLGMQLARKWFSPIGVSVIGGVLHNLGQLLVAILLVHTTALGWYFPLLLLFGVTAGILVGMLAGLCIKRIPLPQAK